MGQLDGKRAVVTGGASGIGEQGSGSLIAVASQLAFVGLERWSSYSAAKSGVVGLVRGIALDDGP